MDYWWTASTVVPFLCYFIQGSARVRSWTGQWQCSVWALIWLRCQFWGCGYPSRSPPTSACLAQDKSPLPKGDPHVGIQCLPPASPVQISVSVVLLLVWGSDATLVYYGKPPGEHKEKQVQQLIGNVQYINLYRLLMKFYSEVKITILRKWS